MSFNHISSSSSKGNNLLIPIQVLPQQLEVYRLRQELGRTTHSNAPHNANASYDSESDDEWVDSTPIRKKRTRDEREERTTVDPVEDEVEVAVPQVEGKRIKLHRAAKEKGIQKRALMRLEDQKNKKLIAECMGSNGILTKEGYLKVEAISGRYAGQ